MSLKVYKDTQASRQYENAFFRTFQANLANLFEKHNKDGVLIGFGELPEGDDLYPDCVLITENRFLIIDFKHCDKMEVYLPSEDSFYYQKWNTNSPKLSYVGGGSSNNANPYVQLDKQRKKFEKLLGYRPNEDVGGIGALVLFDGDVTVVGEQPRREDFWFKIADKYSFLDAIVDMIDLRSENKNDSEAIRAEYFNCEEYLNNVVIDFEAYEAAEKASEELENIRAEKVKLQDEIDEQKRINKELREKGESVEKGIELINEKEELLKQKELQLKEAQEDFDEKKKNYEISENNYKSEAEKTKQEQEKTEQSKISAKIEREKTKQALLQHQELEKVEHRKKTTLIMFAFIFMIIIAGAVVLIVRDINQKNKEREQEEQALINDKKSGKTCIGLDELSQYVNENNVCVEYVVGDISSNQYIVYLNRKTNTDFAAIIWKKNNIISLEDAKTKYLNKRIRVRGKITYYEGSEKYKYYQIEIKDLSQIEILE